MVLMQVQYSDAFPWMDIFSSIYLTVATHIQHKNRKLLIARVNCKLISNDYIPSKADKIKAFNLAKTAIMPIYTTKFF